jgi:hypothetical protein
MILLTGGTMHLALTDGKCAPRGAMLRDKFGEKRSVVPRHK